MSDDEVAQQPLTAHALSFGSIARTYERGRPSYPVAAVDFLLPAGASRIVDVGAGTGKFTAALLDRDADVIAVEPSAGMRAELHRALPQVRALDGAGERIPLPDSCADAVLFAQAWHWVDPGLAVPEAARVLRPGGVLGMVWNMRDERTDWVRELGEILRGVDSSVLTGIEPVVGQPFGPAERAEFPWLHTLSPADLVDLVSSRSYVIVLDETRRREVLEQVRELLDSHSELVGKSQIQLPYVTQCYRFPLLDSPTDRLRE